MKAELTAGWTKTNLEHYTEITKRGLVGADVRLIDGKGNKIEVSIRAGDVGYRITLNGTDIAVG